MTPKTRTTGSRNGVWVVCPGTGDEPVTVTQPERRNKDGKLMRTSYGVCKKCRRVIATPGGRLMNHSPRMPAR